MFYQYIIVDISDELYMEMQRSNLDCFIQVLKQESDLFCEISGRSKVFTKRIITNYRVEPKVKDLSRIIELENKFRTVNEGFELIYLRDLQEQGLLE
jgi:hypothetical protein